MRNRFFILFGIIACLCSCSTSRVCEVTEKDAELLEQYIQQTSITEKDDVAVSHTESDSTSQSVEESTSTEEDSEIINETITETTDSAGTKTRTENRTIERKHKGETASSAQTMQTEHRGDYNLLMSHLDSLYSVMMENVQSHEHYNDSIYKVKESESLWGKIADSLVEVIIRVMRNLAIIYILILGIQYFRKRYGKE